MAAIEIPEGPSKCRRHGDTLEPCRFLDWSFGDAMAGDRPKGIRPLVVLNINTGQKQLFAASYALRGGVGPSGTLVLNRCPWCGEVIAPERVHISEDSTPLDNGGAGR